MPEPDAITKDSPAVESSDCLLTAKELSQRLKGMSKSSIYKMASKNWIPSVSVGARLGGRRFIERDVRAALERLVQPPRPYRPPRDQRAVETVDV